MRQEERWARGTLAGLLAAGALAIAGCGSSDEDGSGGTSGAGEKPPPSPTRVGGPAEREAPPGASPTLRAVYRQFPKPKPDPQVPGAAAAIKAGEAACKGRTPLEVKARYFGQARPNLLPDQRQMVVQIGRFGKTAADDASFPAGQLGALVYEKSLSSERTAIYGYQGCVYQLALEFKRELEKRE
jgi:hypothetical protein